MSNEARFLRGSSGFTLVEVLVSLAILAVIGVGVSAISFSGVVAVKDSAAKHQDGSVAVQFASMVFARDVQGSTGVVSACGDAAGGVRLITLAQSGERAPVEYRRSAKSPYDLMRVTCPSPLAKVPEAAIGKQVLVESAQQLPEVTCDGQKCLDGSNPREVVLSVPREHASTIELVGSRRTDTPEPPPTTTTTTTTTPGPVPGGPSFLALGGSVPLEMGGSAGVFVSGDAFFNAGSAGGDAIRMSGNPKIEVAGDFALQKPGTCAGCEKRANKQPGSYPDAIEDPLGYLASPNPAGSPTRKECRTVGRQAVCSPGVYEGLFPTASGGVSDFLLEPGVYILQYGLTMSHGTISGEGVMLYTVNGAMSISGDSRIKLTPPANGPYEGIAVFQERTGTGSLAIAGNAEISVPGGTIYGATQHLAMSGSSRIEANRILTRSVAMSGNTMLVANGR